MSPLIPIVVAGACGIAFAVTLVLFGEGGRDRFVRPRPPVELMDALKRGLALWGVGSVLLYLFQLLRGKPVFGHRESQLLICTTCFEIHTRDASECPCGGQLEHADYWTRDTKSDPPA